MDALMWPSAIVRWAIEFMEALIALFRYIADPSPDMYGN